MKCDKDSLLLYAVTDSTWTDNKTLYMQVEEALKGGATCIQLREKELDDDTFLEEALLIKKLCRVYHVPFIINDNVDIAIQCGADGIHVGQSDMETGNVRKLVGDDMILGVSAQTVEQAVLAEQNGADYLGVGAVFSTSTKLDADMVSYDTLKAICDAVSIPVVAIGGIYKYNIMELAETGVDGVALISAIFASSDIENECRGLLALSKRMVKTAPEIIKIDGAIFDLDGTLLDSMYIWDAIGGDYLRSLGIEPRENLNRTFKTMSLLQATEYYRSEYGVTLSTGEIMNGVNSMIENFYFHDVQAKTGVKDTLERLKKAGVSMCVATATDRHLAEAALRRNGILEYFSKIFTCTEVGSGKDAPEIFNQALAHLKTPRQSTLVFEDALYAVKTARNAGFTVVAIYDKSEAEHNSEIRSLADIYINSFTEMRSYIDEKGFNDSGL
jgi:thiamine-phosphate diphosphorylase